MKENQNRLAAIPWRAFVPSANNLQFMSFSVALEAGLFDLMVKDWTSASRCRLGWVRAGSSYLKGKRMWSSFHRLNCLGLVAQQQPLLIFANLLQNDPVKLLVRKSIVYERQISPDTPLIASSRSIRQRFEHRCRSQTCSRAPGIILSQWGWTSIRP